MNRRALLAAFLAAPVAVRLGRWSKPAPVVLRDLTFLSVGPGMMFTTLQAALDRAAPGAVVLIAAGHCETINEPLRWQSRTFRGPKIPLGGSHA